MKPLVIYVHGKGENADEAVHYKSLFSDADVLGFAWSNAAAFAASMAEPPPMPMM